MEKTNISFTITSRSQEKKPQVEEEITTKRPDWTLLPLDLITKIGEELSIPHRICFRATCKTWNYAVSPMVAPSPWLLIPNDESEQSDSCTFLSLPGGNFFTYSSIPELRGTRCIGSHGGWLAISNTQLDVSLLNPITRSQVYLPSFVTLPIDDLIHTSDVFYPLIEVPAYYPHKVLHDRLFGKIAFSSKPTIHHYIALILYGAYGKLAYTKASKDEWILLKATSTKDHHYDDVMYHDDKFYCLTNEFEVQAFDLTGDCPIMTVVIKSLTLGIAYFHNILGSLVECMYEKYLACSSAGELFMFLRHINKSFLPNNIELFEPNDFMVMRANPETNPCWAATNDLGSMSLFIGTNNSILISNEDLPILRGDCIFFIDTYTAVFGNDNEQLTCNVGWFNLKEGSRDIFYASSNSQLNLASGIWFTPSLQ